VETHPSFLPQALWVSFIKMAEFLFLSLMAEMSPLLY
jgi:hypothetical protein